MKSTSCIKKDVYASPRLIKRRVLFPGVIKYQGVGYSHFELRHHAGFDVLITKENDQLRVYNNSKKLICITTSSCQYPKPQKKTSPKINAKKKPYTMEIHDSLEHIREADLSDLSLFELSIRALMPAGAFREIKTRLELILTLLEDGAPNSAADIVKRLLASPQKRRRKV